MVEQRCVTHIIKKNGKEESVLFFAKCSVITSSESWKMWRFVHFIELTCLFKRQRGNTMVFCVGYSTNVEAYHIF